MTTQAFAPPTTKSQALRSYDVADFPTLTGLEEEWRFTPLKRLRGLDGGGEVTATPGRLRYEFDALPEGVTFTEASGDDARIGSVLTPFDRISALAYGKAVRAAGEPGQAAGKAGQAVVIAVAPETRPAEPVAFRLVGLGADGATFGHTFIDVGRFAEVTLVLEQTGSITLADNVEVSVGEGATVRLVTIADWAFDAVQAQHVKFRLGRDAKLTHVQVTLGGDLVRQFTSVDYTGRGGEAELYGLYFATELPADPAGGPRRGQHLEHRQLVDHSVPDCRSYVGYRGALQGDGARTVWVGDVVIRAEATGTDTYEINRNLLLTDGARADSVPNLEIETGEVAGAGHASATGRFDDEQLFYLMARGIPEAEARKLVVRGFFAELINKVPVEELRERLGAAIEARLTKAGA